MLDEVFDVWLNYCSLRKSFVFGMGRQDVASLLAAPLVAIYISYVDL